MAQVLRTAELRQAEMEAVLGEQQEDEQEGAEKRERWWWWLEGRK